ncbi:hypothetical protein AKJ16_DCAP04350, partial [Drosera capensis]
NLRPRQIIDVSNEPSKLSFSATTPSHHTTHYTHLPRKFPNFPSPMATTGSLNMKVLCPDLAKVRFATPLSPHRTWVSPQRHGSIVLWQSPCRSVAVSSVPSLGTAESLNLAEVGDEKKSSGPASQLVPNVHEVESLLSELCSTTSIAEFELKLHGFRLYVVRDVTANLQQPAPLTSEPTAANTAVVEENTNAAVSTTSLAIYKPEASERSIGRLLNGAADEGLVGLFQRSRTIKGKRAPPPCKEKQTVKEGQVLCYIDQLGCEFSVETEVAGEVVKILCEEGEPVGYDDPIIAILPSFPGIKILQ